jgi:hypothetical protein
MTMPVDSEVVSGAPGGAPGVLGTSWNPEGPDDLSCPTIPLIRMDGSVC